MHKAKNNFSKVEGLENTPFSFKDHLFLKKNLSATSHYIDARSL